MSLASDIHLKQTERFIDERPVDIVIARREKQDTPDGGWKWGNPINLPPQTVRIVELQRLQSYTERVDENGNVVIPTHSVVGMPDLNVQMYDMFDAIGGKWKVVNISRLPEWRTRLEVTGG